MKLTRRAFFEGVACAMATVAIATRMAPKFLPDDLMGGTWRWEQATKNFYYGIDTAAPWDVTIFQKVFVDEAGDLVRQMIPASEVWKEITPQELLVKADKALIKVSKVESVIERPYKFCVCGFGPNPRYSGPEHRKIMTHMDIEEFGYDEKFSEEMDAACTIGISQSVLAIKHQDGDMRKVGHIAGTGMRDLDITPIPTIHTTKEDLIRYG